MSLTFLYEPEKLEFSLASFSCSNAATLCPFFCCDIPFYIDPKVLLKSGETYRKTDFSIFYPTCVRSSCYGQAGVQSKWMAIMIRSISCHFRSLEQITPDKQRPVTSVSEMRGPVIIVSKIRSPVTKMTVLLFFEGGTECKIDVFLWY